MYQRLLFHRKLRKIGDLEINKVLPKEDHKLAPQQKADETISYTISNFLKENNLQDVLTGNVDIDNLPLFLQYAVDGVLTRFNEYGKSNNQIKDRGQRNTLSRTDGKTSLRGILENQIRESGNRRQGSIETGQRTPLERRLAEIAERIFILQINFGQYSYIDSAKTTSPKAAKTRLMLCQFLRSPNRNYLSGMSSFQNRQLLSCCFFVVVVQED